MGSSGSSVVSEAESKSYSRSCASLPRHATRTRCVWASWRWMLEQLKWAVQAVPKQHHAVAVPQNGRRMLLVNAGPGDAASAPCPCNSATSRRRLRGQRQQGDQGGACRAARFVEPPCSGVARRPVSCNPLQIAVPSPIPLIHADCHSSGCGVTHCLRACPGGCGPAGAALGPGQDSLWPRQGKTGLCLRLSVSGTCRFQLADHTLDPWDREAAARRTLG